MKKYKKRIILGVGVLLCTLSLLFVSNHLDNQKIEEQIQALMDESSEVSDLYEVIAVSVRTDNKTIKVQVPMEEKRQNEIAHSMSLIAQKHGMEDYEIKVSAIKDGETIVN
ncbi:hypothetical protein Q8G35_20320 [Peribacillus simplex]|uniref:Uncharacterized protein n=2 Tax=Peribacillus TaxID=2675229 RepID=A0AA90PIQ3_9BACI|nr:MULTISPECIES: hypothetical protein [Peribacillus]MDP1420656.1 hypothetical protein [Peribacillus simplex]MDP1453130.1 hypothetical protein [Peribacillus frigoritolerans]